MQLPHQVIWWYLRRSRVNQKLLSIFKASEAEEWNSWLEPVVNIQAGIFSIGWVLESIVSYLIQTSKWLQAQDSLLLNSFFTLTSPPFICQLGFDEFMITSLSDLTTDAALDVN